MFDAIDARFGCHANSFDAVRMRGDVKRRPEPAAGEPVERGSQAETETEAE